jgi:hypothetical protein
MRRLSGFVGLVAIVASFSLLVQAEARPTARSRSKAPEKSSGRESEKERSKKAVDEHGRPCEGACKAISSGRGTENRPQEERKSDKEAEIIEASVKSNKDAKVQKEVRSTLEGQVKDLDANAKEGLLFREEMLAKSRSSDSAQTRKEVEKRGEVGFFLTSLVGRLKDNVKEQLETLKKLVCASECGHRGMGKSCRVVAQLAQKLSGAAIPAGVTAISGFAVSEVLKDDGTSKIKVDVSFDGTEQIKSLELDNKEQAEEKVTQNKDSK